MSADAIPQLPKCKVLATVDPDGIVRFDVNQDRAESILENVREALASHDGDGLVEIPFVMDKRVYASLTNGFKQLLENRPKVGEKQVLLDKDPDLSVAVCLNETQMETSATENMQALQMGGPNQMYAQQFAVSENGAKMLVQQLEAAIDGHQNPIKAIDKEDLS